jgi:hypothetical protein
MSFIKCQQQYWGDIEVLSEISILLAAEAAAGRVPESWWQITGEFLKEIAKTRIKNPTRDERKGKRDCISMEGTSKGQISYSPSEHLVFLIVPFTHNLPCSPCSDHCLNDLTY